MNSTRSRIDTGELLTREFGSILLQERDKAVSREKQFKQMRASVTPSRASQKFNYNIASRAMQSNLVYVSVLQISIVHTGGVRKSH